jgi:four helix bundle protein
MFKFEKLSVWQKSIGYAAGSLYEVVTQAHVARRQGFLPEEQFVRIYADAEEISRMLSGLRDSLGGSGNPPG